VPHATVRSSSTPSLSKLTGIFFRIGNTTFGGGLPTIAALQRELSENRGWLSREDFALVFSLAQVTPGTNVIAFCAAAGARILGLWGALSGALAETVPSAILAVLITQGFDTWSSNPWVMGAMAGTIAAVAGMMWSSIWSLAQPFFKGLKHSIGALAILLAAFVAAWKLGFSPLPIIGAAALAGLFWKEPERPQAKS
jgi:chromate transporter